LSLFNHLPINGFIHSVFNGVFGFSAILFSGGYHQVMFGFPQEKRYASYQNLVGFTSVVIKAFSLKIKSFIPDISYQFPRQEQLNAHAGET